MLTSQKVWFIRDGKIGFATLGVDGKMTNLDASSGNKIKMHYFKKDSAFSSTLTETPGFPLQFHDALIFGVLEKIAARKGDPKMARYWKEEYREIVNEAKRYFNQRRTHGYGGGVQLHDH